MKRAAILARVSTDVQSYERQILELKALAKKEGYDVPEDYVYKEKISGFKGMDERLQLSQLLSDIRSKTKDIKMIYVSEISRISRNPRLGREVIEELNDLKIPVYIQNLGMTTLNDDGTRNGIFSIVFQVLIEFAKSESDTQKIRSKSGKRHAASRGRHVGGEFTPFGYDSVDTILVVNDREAEVVRRIYQLVLDGYGAKQIARILNADGVPTKSLNNKKWQDGTVHHILANTLYKGVRSYKGEVFEGMPSIVSTEVWEAAIEAIKARNVKPSNVKYLYLLRNQVVCGVCGNHYTAKYKGAGATRGVKECHYMCSSRKTTDKKCNNCGISIPAIESIVWHLVEHSGKLNEYLQNTAGELETVKKEINMLITERDLLHKDLEKKRLEKKKLNKLYTGGYIDDEELKTDSDKLSRTLNNILHKIESLNNVIKAKTELTIKIGSLENYVKTISKISSSREKINEILPFVLDKVVINSVDVRSRSNFYVISVYMFGNSQPVTVIFNKRKLTYTVVNTKIKYSDKALLLTDVNKIVELNREPLSQTVKLIPFSLINTYREPVELQKAI